MTGRHTLPAMRGAALLVAFAGITMALGNVRTATETPKQACIQLYPDAPKPWCVKAPDGYVPSHP